MKPRKRLDLIGRRFDKLVVVDVIEITPSGQRWLCRCDCGNHMARLTTTLFIRPSSVKSCMRCRVKHGGARRGEMTRLYALWKSMVGRCTVVGHTSYRNYGAKGINVCEQWRTFPPFKVWALANGYSEGLDLPLAQRLSIERKQSKGNYEPDNCEWITRAENSRRANHRPLKLVANG